MLLISQNLTNYDLEFPNNTVLRINLAWISDLNTLEDFISKYDNDIFLDMPLGRKKPPSNFYSIEELKPIIFKNSKIKYFAISNVESPSIIREYYNIFLDKVTLVPKIESIKGIENIKQIADALSRENRTMMLDHDDLYSDIVKVGQTPEDFSKHIDVLVSFCSNEKINLLRTRGVIFSDKI